MKFIITILFLVLTFGVSAQVRPTSSTGDCQGSPDLTGIEEVHFAKNSTRLSGMALYSLFQISSALNSNANVDIVIQGAYRNNSTLEKFITWSQVNKIINTLSDVYNVDRSRLRFDYKNIGTPNIIKFELCCTDITTKLNTSEPPPNGFRKYITYLKK